MVKLKGNNRRYLECSLQSLTSSQSTYW